jgi:hypothetical protein
MTAIEIELFAVYTLACRGSGLNNIQRPENPRVKPGVSFVRAFITETQKILKPLREAGRVKLHNELHGKLLAVGLKYIPKDQHPELRKAL